MTATVQKYLSILKSKDYRRGRKDIGFDLSVYQTRDPRDPMLPAEIFALMMDAEEPYILDTDDAFGFHRTIQTPPVWKQTRNDRAEYGAFGNITPNYAAVIARGLDSIREDAQKRNESVSGGNRFWSAVVLCADEILSLVDRYRQAAEEMGNECLAKALSRVPHKGATTYHEACLFLALLLYSLRCANHPHTTLGRFDQYMLPYFEADLAHGVTREELLETTELFFIELNLDTDIYFGVQQGDNGQSMVLGGFDKNGNDMFNTLSDICMQASLELSLIDPKINLRCGKATPLSLFERGTELTKQGLGFPQYCNDDVVVPGLIALGYDEEDAWNYTVAACWEYIVPNCAADVPNRAALNFPLAVSRAVRKHLLDSESFEELLEAAKEEIRRACDEIVSAPKESCIAAPLLSMMVDGCMEAGKDLTEDVAKYNNYGSHGTGIADAADALAAIKILIYDSKLLSKETLLTALEQNFEGYTKLRNQLLNAPKVGNDNDVADTIACELLETFSSTLNHKPNGRGGIWRAGTGSAMHYIWCGEECPATANGRLAGEPFSSSFSPAITTRLQGPLSTIRSFTKYDMKRIINGGPLTMELHDSVFRTKDGAQKVAALVRYFIELGGHQLQLNAINREVLLDAEAHPENYPNLIVRVWGWSGYFCELDPDYRKHIIARTEFTV